MFRQVDPRNPPISASPSARIINVCPHTQLFMWVLEMKLWSSCLHNIHVSLLGLLPDLSSFLNSTKLCQNCTLLRATQERHTGLFGYVHAPLFSLHLLLRGFHSCPRGSVVASVASLSGGSVSGCLCLLTWREH